MRNNSYYCIVRTGTAIKDTRGQAWTPIVHRCPINRDGVAPPELDYVSYVVCLHGPRMIQVQSFDVHCGRYLSEEEETSVHLSASSTACSLAAFLSSLHAFQLDHYIARNHEFADLCRRAHVRSALYREANPERKFAKNHEVPLACRVPRSEQLLTDWKEFDPEESDMPA